MDPAELARNPFRMFTSRAGARGPAVLRRRPRRPGRDVPRPAPLFPPELVGPGRPGRRRGRSGTRRRRAVPRRGHGRAFTLSREPVDLAWYRELERVSSVAADIAGVGSTHINHLTPRVLDIDLLLRADERPRHRDDPADPGAAALGRPGGPAAADLVPGAGGGPPVPYGGRLGRRRRAAGPLRRGRGPRDGADPGRPGPVRRAVAGPDPAWLAPDLPRDRAGDGSTPGGLVHAPVRGAPDLRAARPGPDAAGRCSSAGGWR